LGKDGDGEEALRRKLVPFSDEALSSTDDLNGIAPTAATMSNEVYPLSPREDFFENVVSIF